MAFFRAVSPLERTYFYHDHQQIMPACVTAFVKGQGEFALGDLYRAAQKVLAANPGYGLKRRGRLRFSRWDDSVTVEEAVEIIELDNDIDPEQEGPVADFITRPFDARQGKLIRIFLRSGDPCYLIFQVHHSLSDGSGGYFFVEEFFRALRAEPLKGSEYSINELEVCQQHQAGKIQMIDGRVKNLFVADTSLAAEPLKPMWAKVHVPIEDQQFISKCLKAFTQVGDAQLDGKARFRVTVDLRRYLREALATDENDIITVANASTGIDLDVPKHNSAADIHRDLVHKLKSKAALFLPPAALVEAAKWVPSKINGSSEQSALAAYQRNGLVRNATLSHLGWRSKYRYVAPNFRPDYIYNIPPFFRRSPLFLTSIFNEDGLWLCATAPKMFAANGQLQKVLADVAEMLVSDQ